MHDQIDINVPVMSFLSALDHPLSDQGHGAFLSALDHPLSDHMSIRRPLFIAADPLR